MFGFCDSLRELIDKDEEIKRLKQQQRQPEEQEHQQDERLQTCLKEVSGQEIDEYAQEKEKSKEKEVLSQVYMYVWATMFTRFLKKANSLARFCQPRKPVCIKYGSD